MDAKQGGTVILKRDGLGRVTHSRQQRERLLDEFERSGMKGVPFARMAGINYQTFASWIQKRRRARGDYLGGPAPMSAAAPGCPRGGAALRLVEVALPVVAASPAPTPEVAAPLELLLPGGARLLLREACHAELAVRLLRALAPDPSSPPAQAPC